MAKISPISIKYMIYAKLEAEGTLEKPDVIGAIFGQTEGLLGKDLEMRDLQKEGKIGRIEVELDSESGKTIGKIEIPSALDKTETTLIAAAIETIERVGPSDAKVEVERIEDVRGNKREYILERAKKLLEGVEEKMPKTREIAKNLRVKSREEKLKEYGKEKLPAGNLESEEIIVVEGRADVINLLRNNVENVIGMNGTILPETIKELSYDKEITLFVDGDRGGKLIAKNVAENARIDYVAFAPDGKEVEELSDKEILLSLRKKIPVQEFLGRRRRRGFQRQERAERQKRGKEEPAEAGSSEDSGVEEEKLRELLKEVENTKSALILDKNLKVSDKVSARGLFSALENSSGKSLEKGKVYGIVVDTATPTVIKAAEKHSVEIVAAKNFSSSSERVRLVSL